MPTEPRLTSRSFPVENYNLSVTLDCGQAFRWRRENGHWVGIVANHWLQASHTPKTLKIASSAERPVWDRIANYFQPKEKIDAITAVFPSDEHLREAVRDYRGLRLLRQEPWECLASFILSSTKQIPHIQQIIARLAQRYGHPLPTPSGYSPAFSFPPADRIAKATESDLRSLGMGYRAPFLKHAAEAVHEGRVQLSEIHELDYHQAQEILQTLQGVGPKIAACVLLFAYGNQDAFPIDVWVRRALKELYFPQQSPSDRELEAFSQEYFRPYSGYAQQYLFHYIRMQHRAKPSQQPRSGNMG